ncbi:MAG: trypsin-like peptidase domain-containing protein [Tannerellaceae bacterium]|nr:trypsin-like peptidase domain-containing protein [Tannerellaceae bacterium]
MIDNERSIICCDAPSQNSRPQAEYAVIVRETPSKNPRKRKKYRFAALLATVCITVSAVSGFAGGYVAELSRQDAFPAAGLAQAASSATGTQTFDDSASFAADVYEARPLVQIIADAKKTVVEINTESTNRWTGQQARTGAGSGVIISADGYIITNNHVISGAAGIEVRLADGTTASARVVGADSKTDLAVLKIEKTNLAYAVLGDSSQLQIGESAMAIGNPLGSLGGTVTGGIISALDRELVFDGEPISLLQTDAAINPGNSGGGLFNVRGELVGIVNAKSTGLEIEGLGFAIPINTAKTVTTDLIAYGYVKGRIDTGFSVVEISDIQSMFMSRVSRAGLYISASSNASFKPGDQITAVDGSELSSTYEYTKILNTHKIGDTLQISIIRSNQKLTVPLTLTEAQG